MAFPVTGVQEALKGADHPMTSGDLGSLAEKDDGASDLVEALRGVGKDSFDGPTDGE